MRCPLAPLLLSLALASCGGAQRADDSDWTPELQTKHKHLRDTETLFGGQPLDVMPAGHPALIGVRHDLMLSSNPHEARCACLAVEAGRADDPAFFWAGGAPEIGADALVIGVGARGIACPGGDPDDRRRRPSISAVDQEGEDIVIEIEDLPLGRPLASGAIIPRPGPKGAIYVRPHRANAVYARTPGMARCRVR